MRFTTQGHQIAERLVGYLAGAEVVEADQNIVGLEDPRHEILTLAAAAALQREEGAHGG